MVPLGLDRDLGATVGRRLGRYRDFQLSEVILSYDLVEGQEDCVVAQQGELLYTPSPERIARANLTSFGDWLGARTGVRLDGYDELWQWSIDNDDDFWRAVWLFSELTATRVPDPMHTADLAPGTRWGGGAKLNFAENALRGAPSKTALVVHSERDRIEVTYGELRSQVARVAAALRTFGVEPGDCVAAYLPVGVEVVVAFLACASIGAVWTVCSPDFGVAAVVDRFRQAAPRVLFATDGYRYGDRAYDRIAAVQEISGALDSIERVVLISDAGTRQELADAVAWSELLAEPAELHIEHVAFEHPLWIVYTSGTTGAPKALVHGHGGIILELNKLLRLHLDLGPDDRFFWFSTTGWVMWNIVLGGLLIGCTVVMYDGDPGWPNIERVWDVAAADRITALGLSAALVNASMKAEAEPARERDLSSLRFLGVTGSPLSPAGAEWLGRSLGDEVFVGSISGGPDVCTAFVGCVPTLPMYAGEIQRPCLGVDARCIDPQGEPTIGEVGELAICSPLPSMPLRILGDGSGERYREAYFPRRLGLWEHGDWVEFTDRGTCIVHGRSDATLNRHGVRMGTSEFYAALESCEEIVDSVVIDTTPADGDVGELLLLVVLADGHQLDDELRMQISATLRTQLSPRHVPDEVLVLRALPHTLNGKRLEIPIKRIFQGAPVGSVADLSALDDPGALEAVVALATAWRAQSSRVATTSGT
jgi:acetoacetyl-CoA synthetase